MGAFCTIELRPHLLQYCICEWWHVFLCVLSFALAGLDVVDNSTVSHLLTCFALFLLLYLAYQFFYLALRMLIRIMLEWFNLVEINQFVNKVIVFHTIIITYFY